MFALRDFRCRAAAPQRPGEHRAGDPPRQASAGSDLDAGARRGTCDSLRHFAVSSRRRAEGQRVTLAVAARVRTRPSIATAAGQPARMGSGQLEDHSHYRPCVRAVVRNADCSIAAGLFAYALIELVEAVGLWLMRRWGEYFAVIATSIFLPLEIYELTEKITVLRLFALAGQHRRSAMAAVEQTALRTQWWREGVSGRTPDRKPAERRASRIAREPLPAQRRNLRRRLQGGLVLQRVGNRVGCGSARPAWSRSPRHGGQPFWG